MPEFKDYAIAAGLGAAGGFLSHQTKANTQKKIDTENERVSGLQQQKARQLARNNMKMATFKHGQAIELEGIKSGNVLEKTKLELASKEKIAGMKPDTSANKSGLTDNQRMQGWEALTEEWKNDPTAQGTEASGAWWWKEDAVPPSGLAEWAKVNAKERYELLTGSYGGTNQRGAVVGGVKKDPTASVAAGILAKHDRVKVGGANAGQTTGSGTEYQPMTTGGQPTQGATSMPPGQGIQSSAYSGIDKEGAYLQPGTLSVDITKKDEKQIEKSKPKLKKTFEQIAAQQGKIRQSAANEMVLDALNVAGGAYSEWKNNLAISMTKAFTEHPPNTKSIASWVGDFIAGWKSKLAEDARRNREYMNKNK